MSGNKKDTLKQNESLIKSPFNNDFLRNSHNFKM